MLPAIITREVSQPKPNVLELAPKACFTNYCRRHHGWSYTSSDLSSPTAMVHADLRKMPFETGTFDLIVIFHVMEHIIEDDVAFREIARMLRPDGLAIICVPIFGDVTQEGAPEADWERVYGQVDHVRVYGFDVEERIRAAGLVPNRIDTLEYFSREEFVRHALGGDDRYLFLARKEPTT